MTKIINGYAQADLEITKQGETRIIFVETPSSLRANAHAISKSHRWLQRHRANSKVDLYVTKPRG